MRRSLIIAGSILVVLAAVVIAVPFVVDLGDYRQRLEDMAKSVTGRSLRIEGPIRVTLFPHLGIKAETVALANMPGGRAAAMARANDIQLSIRLIPLLFGRVEVDRIVLERPVIALEVDKGGASNWSLGGNNPKPGGTSVTLPSSTLFSGVTVQDGDITYDNYKSSSHYAFEHVNADVALTRLDQPIQVDGNLALAGRQVDFHADVATVQKLLSNGTTTLGLTLKSDAFEASLKGSVAPDGRVDGDATFNTASLRSAAGLFGEKLPAGDSFGLARFRSHVVVENRIATLSPMLLALDGQSITGDLTFDETGAVTIVSGALQADRLDLNPFFPTRRRAPVAAGWSREPLDLSMLRDVDARLSLTADALRLRQLRLGRTVTQFRLDNGALTARLEPVSLYGGTGRVELELQCTASVPAVKSSLAFEHVALRPFLNDALGIDSIDGSGTLNLTIAGEGDNAFAIMHSLSGSGAIAAADGRVRGVDLGAVSRTIQAV
ncbi:MAG TPA: AsmA family protein, partial [Rhizomicrobium sp.]|nr:AsmA family protein [Rhizomicrobium sp.]